ncbi:alpha/beta hydrolase [Nocardia huaxiensis]|uniref:alpha/beta hydrolase n=1 Tax=Nocardia huaxiensis TaxID=2755382 RepID=UPI001E3E0240|nr:alpha/beta hydrolase [Nocardia huaxiensis]UFS96938.1 alpha/beta hydrolase family protein [Nocardia huaxiensis]
MSKAAVSQVRSWRPLVAAVASEAVVSANRRFRAAMDEVGRGVDAALAQWQGPAATASALRMLESQLRANHIGAVLIDIADALADIAALDGFRAAVREIEREAAAKGCELSDDGSVSPPCAASGNPVVDLALQVCFDAEAAALQARLVPLLHQAGDTDQHLGERLSAAAETLYALAAAPDPEPRDPTVLACLAGTGALPEDPKLLCVLWESLSPADRDALFAYDPAIGNRDGIPAVARDYYNRLAIDHQRETVRAQLTALECEHPDWVRDRNLPTGYADGVRLIEWTDARIALENRLAGYDSVLAASDSALASRLLLAVDDDGHAAIAMNNPDSARNVAAFVPGTDSTLDTLTRGVQRASALFYSARFADPAARTSVITWYGYDSPPGLGDALLDRFADEGGPALDRFTDGLRATHDGLPSHNTLVGHSYGSTLIGVAAGDGGALAVDDLIFAGSPGVEAGHVSDLRLEGIAPADNHEHVFATADGADPIPYFGGVAHGVSPADPLFGATVFTSSGATLDLPLLRGIPLDPWAHGSYWDADNPGLRTQGEIIAGVYDR